MLVQALLICLLANVYLAESAEIVVGSVLRPKGISVEAHNEEIRKFWTPEKLNAAKSLDLVLPGLPSSRTSANTNVSIGPESSIPGSIPSTNPKISKTIASRGRQYYTTGKVFFQANGGYYVCSAAIVSSTSGDLVSTAGHCVYDADQHVWHNSYWVFIPAYSNGNAPYGIWPARNFIALTSWTNSHDYNADVGFVALATLNGKHIQSYLGSEGIGFNFARLKYTYAFGYPVNLNGGEYLKSCVGYAQNPTGAGSAYHGQRLLCNMGGGCSGGPWLQSVNERNGVGYVTAVNSFGISSAPGYLFGPYFDSNIKFLYDAAKTM